MRKKTYFKAQHKWLLSVSKEYPGMHFYKNKVFILFSVPIYKTKTENYRYSELVLAHSLGKSQAHGMLAASAVESKFWEQ